MTRRRFYAPPEAFAPDGARVVLSREETAHLVNVLRLRAGDEVFVFDGAGREFRCVITEARGRDGRAPLEVVQQVEPQRPESPLELTLAVALLKGEKFDLVVQKACELGVARIVPVVTARGDVRLRAGSGADARVARWQRLALEAAKQSGRARVPTVSAPVSLEPLLTNEADASSMRLLFTERDGCGLLETSNSWAACPSTLTALVGPEGGWADEELALGRAAGWQLITLGGRTLRAESAAIVVPALLQHLCGDLR
ncbi:MAG: 16S rRNA (uracil(1498)-N(3))-methyltransferase [Acidobacteria bacterium]|nr:MAG: 16S rRNA (uracil(1498)-N(3))-methyltransferase [Acidobacteriota bacterium]